MYDKFIQMNKNSDMLTLYIFFNYCFQFQTKFLFITVTIFI